MNDLHLAQVNVAKRLVPMDDPIINDFVHNLDIINDISDNSEGFIWRLKDEDKDKAQSVFQDDTLIINMSVWTGIEAFYTYTYKSGHIEVFKRKKEWFSKIKMKHMAFWYIPLGYEPTFQDAKTRLDYLNTHEETPYAFSFKERFPKEAFLKYKPIL